MKNPKFSFTRYTDYKDSGVEWLGDIPEHWKSEKGKWLFLKMDRPVRHEDDVVTAFRDGQVTLRINRRTEGFTNAIKEHGYQGIRKGDLVIHAMDAFAGAIGVSESDGKSTPVYSACVPRKPNTVTPELYAYLLRYMAHSGFITTLAKGIRERSTDFRFNDFGALDLPLPPKPEQDRIVAFLDQKTAEIDALIAKKQRQIELLDEQKAILINRAVTRGLNPKTKLKPSGIAWIGEIPAHWEVKKLRWLLKSSVKNGISPPISEKGRVPTLSIAAVKYGQVTFGENVKFTAIHKSEAASYLLREGDILALRGNGSRHLVATAGIVGTDVPEGCIYPDLLIRIQPTSLIAPKYLVIQLNGVLRDGINLIAKTSAGIWKVSGESLSAQQVLLPSPDEQSRILDYVDFVQDKTAVCNSRIGREIQSLKTLRSTLIAHAVTGRIKV